MVSVRSITCPVHAIADCRVPQVEDAEIRNKTYRHGDKLIVTCHEGFKIRYPDLHNMVSLCRDDGTWDNLPLCQGGCRARVPNRSRGPRSACAPCTGIGVPAPSLQKHSRKYLIVQEIGRRLAAGRELSDEFLYIQ